MDELTLYLPGILLSYAAFLLAIASPGPNILAVMGTSMSVGRASGLALAMGIACGSFTWAMLTAFGLSAIIAGYAPALIGIKIAGGCYLLYLAYKAFRSAANKHEISAKQLEGGKRTQFGYAMRGYVIMMTNPKAALAWVAIIAIGLKDAAPIWVAAAIVLGTFVMSVTIHALYALAFSTPTMVKLYSNARRKIQFAFGAFFTFAGLRILLSR
ncbi:MAG: LysE family translocator [Pseudomonadota bacterium]